MAIDPNLKVWELVDRAVSHHLSVPEFQRGFVWKPTQVRDLAESLWLDYPVGSLLIWNSQNGVEERITRDAKRPNLWIVDGQQRTTALCIPFGRKPYWWPSADDRDRTIKRYDIRFDANAKEAPYFLVANAAIRKAKGDRYVPLSRLLVLDTQKEKDQKELRNLAKEIKVQGLCDGMDAMEVYSKLDHVRKIRENDLVNITVNHELEDVVEIFSRLNSKGTRVTEADIYLGIVAARAPGWVRDEFLPFLKVLKDYGFDLSPNLLFRSLTAIAAGKTRFRDIPDDVWDADKIKPAWKRCQDGWKNLVKRFAEYGVLSNEPLPTEAALVTLIALQDRFPTEPSFDLAFYWFLQASRFGRYSGSATTSLDEDLRDVADAKTMREAVTRLLHHFDHVKPMPRERPGTGTRRATGWASTVLRHWQISAHNGTTFSRRNSSMRRLRTKISRLLPTSPSSAPQSTSASTPRTPSTTSTDTRSRTRSSPSNSSQPTGRSSRLKTTRHS